MKKLIITIAIVLGLGMASYAQGGSSMFKRENSGSGSTLYQKGENDGPIMPGLPSHGETDNQNAPLGSGIALLAGLGAAYLVGKKRNEK